MKVKDITITVKTEDSEHTTHLKVADALEAAGIEWRQITSNWEGKALDTTDENVVD